MSTHSTLLKDKLDFGHLGIVVSCAAFLLFITVMKSGFVLPWNMEAQADAKPILTLEEAKRQAVAKNNIDQNFNSSSAQDNNQLALLDPNLNRSAVLGVSTEELQFPAAEEIFTKESLDAIKIKSAVATTKESVQKYAEQVLLIESYFDVSSLLTDINSDDITVLKQVPKKAKVLVANLGQVEVPTEVVEYHKLKMIYYTTLGRIADIFSGEEKQYDLQTASSALFSLMEKLDRIKNTIITAYGVEL